MPLPPGWTTDAAPAHAPFRRPAPPAQHAPRNPSPLSPLHTSKSPPAHRRSLSSPRIPITLLNNPFASSHYYRAPRSALTSPTRSNLPSPSGSPTRKSLQQKIAAALASDELLASLTPASIRALAADPERGFTTSETEWTIIAADAIESVEAWLAEVEGWGKTWGKGQKGEGYLPPRPTDLCAIEEDERPPDPTLPEEFCGSLPRVWVQHVGERAHTIRGALEELTVDGLKHQVMTYTRPGTFTLTSPSTILTAATLRLLPLLYRLTKLLSLWTVRVAVLKAVPIFLKHLERSKRQLAHAEEALRSLDADVFGLLRENVERQILFAGGVMDNMLDILESYQDVLPDAWIVQLEDTEARYAQWVMDAERHVLQTQLRQPREAAESQIRGLEEAREGLELEARRDEEVLQEVMEEAGQGERALEELMERSDEVAGAQLDGASMSEEDTTEGFEMIGLGLGGLEGLELEPGLVEEERGRRWKRHGSCTLSLLEEGLVDDPAVATKVDPETPAKMLAFIPSEEPTPRASPVMSTTEEEVHHAGVEDRTGGAEVKDEVLSPQTATCTTEVDQQATTPTETTFTQEPSVAETSKTIAEPEHSAPSGPEEPTSNVNNERTTSPEPTPTSPPATHTDTVEPVLSAVDKQEAAADDIALRPKEEPVAAELTRRPESEETPEADSPDHGLPTISAEEITSAHEPTDGVVGDQRSEPEIVEVADPLAETEEFGEITRLNAVQQAPLNAEIEILQTEALRRRDVPSESATCQESDVAIPMENTVKHELLEAEIEILPTEALRERDVPSEPDTVVQASGPETTQESDVATPLEEDTVKHELLNAEMEILQTDELHERDPGVLEPQFEMPIVDGEIENEEAEDLPATTESVLVQPDAACQLLGLLEISQSISSDKVSLSSELDEVWAAPEVTQESPQTEAIAAAISADIEDLSVEDEYIVVCPELKEEEPVVDEVTERSAIPDAETVSDAETKEAADAVKGGVSIEDISAVKSIATSDADPTTNVREVAIDVAEAPLQSEVDVVEAPKHNVEEALKANLEFEPIIEVSAIVDEKVGRNSAPATEIEQAVAVIAAETAPQPSIEKHEQLAKANEQPLAPTEEPTPANPTAACKTTDDISSIQDMSETASVHTPQDPSFPPRSESAASLVESDCSSVIHHVLPAVSNSDSKHTDTLDAEIPSPPPGSTISTPESVCVLLEAEPDDMQLQLPEDSPMPALLPSPVFMSAKEEILLEAEARDEEIGIRSLGVSRAATPDNSNGMLAGLGIMTGSDESGGSSIELDDSETPEARTPEFEDDDFQVSDDDFIEETYLFTTPPVRSSTAGQSSRRTSHVMAPDLPSIIESSPRPAKEGYFGGSFTEEMSPPLPRFVRPAKRLSVKMQAAKLMADQGADGSVKYKVNGKGRGKGKTSVQSASGSPATPNTETGRNAGPVTDHSPFSRLPVVSPAGKPPRTPGELSSSDRPSSREATPETLPRPRKITVVKRLPGERTARPAPTPRRATSNPQVPGPRTPKKAPTSMDDHVSHLLQSLPGAVRLTSSNLAALNATKPIPFSLSSTPASDSGASQTPSYAASTTSRPRNSSVQADIKCYHLHRSDNAPPMKLYVRLVGNARLVCRVGGGWSDLEEYLKEWALHHGSKMRKVSESLTVQDIPVHNGPAGQRTLRPSASNSSLNRSRPTSPSPRAASPVYSNSPPRVGPAFAGTVEISPPAAARPGSSHSLRRKTSRLSFSEGVDEVEEKPKMLGLAGPRGKKKELGGDSIKWIEGMLGQVRKASVTQGAAAEMEDAIEDEGEPEVKVKGRQRSSSNVSAGVGEGAVRRVFVGKGGRKSLGAGGVGGIGR